MLVVLRVHILAESPVVLSPYQRGMEYLDEHCMRDRDGIPKESIHYLGLFCKTFLGILLASLQLLYDIFMWSLEL